MLLDQSFKGAASEACHFDLIWPEVKLCCWLTTALSFCVCGNDRLMTLLTERSKENSAKILFVLRLHVCKRSFLAAVAGGCGKSAWSRQGCSRPGCGKSAWSRQGCSRPRCCFQTKHASSEKSRWAVLWGWFGCQTVLLKAFCANCASQSVLCLCSW